MAKTLIVVGQDEYELDTDRFPNLRFDLTSEDASRKIGRTGKVGIPTIPNAGGLVKKIDAKHAARFFQSRAKLRCA